MSIATRSWTRPDAIAAGRLPMTSRRPAPDEVVSLDGPWSFTLLDRPGGAVRVETTVEVPGCWTMQDVGDHPQYTNIQMPFPGPPPHVPEDNPTGVYRRQVDVPAEWAGRRIVLRVGGAETVLYVAVDGVEVAMGTDSRLHHDVDLTDLVTPGAAFDLELTVVRWGAATYLEDQDHWHHAGLHRSVLLYSLPATAIADVHAVADWDPTTGDGRLDVRVTTAGPPLEGARLRFRLDDGVVGEVDAQWPDPDTFLAAYGFNGVAGRLEVDVPGVAPWSAEHPNLHDLTVELVAGGEVVDATSYRVGFRRVVIEGPDLLVNGRRVLIKGVNRHDHDPHRGKAVTADGIRRDLELMKAHNLNAVRTSHYPNDPVLYDLCDELGLYVVDEADVEAHAYLGSLTKAPEWSAAILERITRMAVRDKNHPCVIVWSLGNESGASPVHDAAAAWLRAYDPSRPVQYESGYFDHAIWNGLRPAESWHTARLDSDLVPPMYPHFHDLEQWAALQAPERPLILCEYIHAMNNSCGDLDRYWDLIRSTPGFQGGFIWDWVDQALVKRDADGQESLAYGGDFGDEPNDGPFCLNGLVAADRTPHPSLLEARVVLQPVRFDWLGAGAVRLTNEHDFTDLADVADVDWVVTVDGAEVAAGSLGRVAAAPGETVEVAVPVPELALTAWQVAHLTIRVGTVATGQTELGRSEVRTPGGEPVKLPTRLSLWRAPIDNETFGPNHAERWRGLGIPSAHEQVELRTEVDGALVTHEVTVPEAWTDLPRVGVRLELPAGVAAVEWVGRGPHECYSDRRAGAFVGRWRTTVDEWPTPYVHPQANGNRCDVRALRFLDADGAVLLTIDELDDLDVSVSRWTDEEMAAATHLEELPPSSTVYAWIDAEHRGVGSAAVGPDVSPEHRVEPGTYRWSYRLS